MERVVSIVPYRFLPAKIGGQKGIAYFNEYFGQYVKLSCLTVESNDNLLARNYEAIHFFSDSRLRYANPFYILKARKWIRRAGATHLLVEHPYFGWLGVCLKHLCSVKLIVHSHNIEALRFKTIGKWWWPILWQYEKWTHQRANFNLFIHEDDRQYAVQNFRVSPSKCIVATYGITLNAPPRTETVVQAREKIRKENNVLGGEFVLFFNGSFNYKPNVDALRTIADVICPALDHAGFSYKVIVCGPWLQDKNIHHPNLIIKGFVDSIEEYFDGADVFLNPVIDGGGIKTKLVEALGHNVNAVSTKDGATGINPAICNGKLLLSANGDWTAFCQNIIKATSINAVIPGAFYDHFYWQRIAYRAAKFIGS